MEVSNDLVYGTTIQHKCPRCQHENNIWIKVEIDRHRQQIILCDGCDEPYTIYYRIDVTVYGVEPVEA